MKRPLYLAAYDVADNRRLRHALLAVKDFATGGQKSVFECFLSESERAQLMQRVRSVIDPDEDRFFLVRLSTRRAVRTLGIAAPPADPDFYYVG